LKLSHPILSPIKITQGQENGGKIKSQHKIKSKVKAFDHSCFGPEAELFGVLGTKVFRVFLLAISHKNPLIST
jgi:hypothetical protein